MIFLGLSEDQIDILWSARPIAGTQAMPKAWVKHIEEVPSTVKVYINTPA